MPNEYFTADGSPSTSSFGASATIRNDFLSIQAGFDKLPVMTGHALALVRVNATGTALESTGTQFAYNETPVGPVNGTNDTFTLAHNPSPAASLDVFINGLHYTAAGVDYDLVGNTIIFVTAMKPQTGDKIVCEYTF